MKEFLGLLDNSQDSIEKEWRLISSGDFINIVIPASKFKNFVRKEEGDLEFVFQKMTCGEYWEIEKLSGKNKDGTIEYQNMRLLILKRMLKSWNLNIELFFDKDGYLEEQCFQKIIKMPEISIILSSIIDKYEDSFYIDNEEKLIIDKQAAILFAKESKGVDDPCEAITLYCVLSGFWEKFGINRFDIKKFPYKEFVELRMMMGKENEARERDSASSRPTKDRPVTNIVGAGGRIIPSKGKVTPLPGSQR